jgi:hypothetical protein
MAGPDLEVDGATAQKAQAIKAKSAGCSSKTKRGSVRKVEPVASGGRAGNGRRACATTASRSPISLRVPANIPLVPLPPYSTELNPVERVCDYLKERSLLLRLPNDYDAIADAASKACNRPALRPVASPRSVRSRGLCGSNLRLAVITCNQAVSRSVAPSGVFKSRTWRGLGRAY